MLCDRLLTNLWPGHNRPELPVWLGKSLHEIKFSWVNYDWFMTVPNDIRGHQVNRYQPAKTCDQRRIQLRVGSLTSEIDKFQDRFLTVKSDRGTCRFQWQEGLSYCEYSEVTYDLLVSYIGGTYDLADWLTTSLAIFGRKSVPSPSGVRCKPSISQHWFR